MKIFLPIRNLLRLLTDFGYTAIKFIETVPANAKIVTKGAFYLLSAMKGCGEHEH
jgi:cobalt-zinc-cadmium efflux system membrane fusion protein